MFNWIFGTREVKVLKMVLRRKIWYNGIYILYIERGEIMMRRRAARLNEERPGVLKAGYSSYRGRVHIPNITTEPDVFAGRKIYTNSGCAGHVVVEDPGETES